MRFQTVFDLSQECAAIEQAGQRVHAGAMGQFGMGGRQFVQGILQLDTPALQQDGNRKRHNDRNDRGGECRPEPELVQNRLVDMIVGCAERVRQDREPGHRPCREQRNERDHGRIRIGNPVSRWLVDPEKAHA